MADSISRPPVSVPVPSRDGDRSRLDVGRPVMARAVHSGPSAGERAWSRATKDALIRYYGSLKAAAIAMGNYDSSQLSRDLDTGKFRSERLDLCDEEAKAYVSQTVAQTLASRDPKARVRRLIAESRRLLDELADAIAS